MQLHRNIPESELPLSLKKPLVFGDREQINALNALEADINLLETEQAAIADGDLKYFDVCIQYTGEQNLKILAVSKADAEIKAKDEADIDDADIEIDLVHAREVKR